MGPALDLAHDQWRGRASPDGPPSVTCRKAGASPSETCRAAAQRRSRRIPPGTTGATVSLVKRNRHLMMINAHHATARHQAPIGTRHGASLAPLRQDAAPGVAKSAETGEDHQMRYPTPGQPGSAVTFKPRYDNFIGGEWAQPTKGHYFENISPVTGKPYCEVARSDAEDINRALDAAHRAKDRWGKTSPADRALMLTRIADRMEANLEKLAVTETWDNGKPIRETLAADIPLAIDHFRYFAGCIRAQEGTISEVDENTVAYHFHEPLGVVGQIIPWNFPILMAAWKLAPAIAAGNCVVLKPAEQTPTSILVLMELVQDLIPPGVLNIVNGL